MDATAAAGKASAWAWEEFGEGFKAWAGTLIKRKTEDAKEQSEKLQALKHRWADFQWKQAAQRYQERLQKRYGQIRVLGSTRPIDLGEIFTDVHILEKPQAYRRFDISQLHKLQSDPGRLKEDRRTPGIRVVQRQMGHRLFILGKPGSGKTTFLKFLVHLTLQGKLDKLPIFVTLKDWSESGLDLMAFIEQQFDICRFPEAGDFIEYLLESGGAIVLFDGLDEVRREDQQREQAITGLQNFYQKYLETQIVITCRVAATDYAFDEFTYIEMADFNNGQIETYSYKWFSQHADKATQFLAELKKSDNKGVRDLGRSPLLLSLICLAYDETLHIPQRRVELYEEALEALLKKWDSSRKIQRDEVYKKLSLGRKKQMFARIAASSFIKGETFFTKQQLSHQITTYIKNLPPVDANEDFDSEVVLQVIAAQHGIFVERARDIYSFAHLTFQEYFTAKYFADNIGHVALNQLMLHLPDSRWREVFLLTASLLDEADEFIKAMEKTIMRMINSDGILLLIQQQTERKSATVTGLRAKAIRAVYWSYNLARDHALDRVLANALDLTLDVKLTLALALDLDHGLDLNYILELARARDRIFDLILNLALDLDLNLDLAIALDLDRSINFDYAPVHALDRTLDHSLDRTRDLDRIRDSANTLVQSLAHTYSLSIESALDLQKTQKAYLEGYSSDIRQEIAGIFNDANLTNLLLFVNLFTLMGNWEPIKKLQSKLAKYCTALQKQPEPAWHPAISAQLNKFPTQRATRKEWKIFYQELYSLAIDYNDIGYELEISREQYRKIAQYFSANQLLLDCLEVAYVSDRQAILDRLLTVDDPEEK